MNALIRRVYGFGGLERWNGMVDWTGMEWNGMEWWACLTFDLKFRGGCLSSHTLCDYVQAVLLGMLAGE